MVQTPIPHPHPSPAWETSPVESHRGAPESPGKAAPLSPASSSPPPRAAVPFVRGNKGRSVRCGDLARLPPPPRSRAGPAQKPRCSSRAGAEVSGQPGRGLNPASGSWHPPAFSSCSSFTFSFPFALRSRALVFPGPSWFAPVFRKSVAQSTLQLNPAVCESMLAGRGVPAAPCPPCPPCPGVSLLSPGRAVAWRGAAAGGQSHPPDVRA